MKEAESFEAKRAAFYANSHLINSEDVLLNDGLMLSIQEFQLGKTKHTSRTYFGDINEEYLTERPMAILQFADGNLREIIHHINPESSSSLYFEDGLWLTLSSDQSKPGDEIDPNPLHQRHNRLRAKYDTNGKLKSFQVAFFGKSDVAESAFLELDTPELATIPQRIILPNRYSNEPSGSTYNFDIKRSEGTLYFSLLGHDGVTGEAFLPQNVDVKHLLTILFPHEKGTNTPPYFEPILLSNPNISRSKFPRDSRGNIIDLDEVWRSTSIARLIGAVIYNIEPLDSKAKED